ncbi:uncharacterized protein [Eucyclogobius newberryi]|uniref:uncharacterized protein n=1 Tax=Eucyclogobius newberryi TaxID=166745 RepID=UPI003B5B2B3D
MRPKMSPILQQNNNNNYPCLSGTGALPQKCSLPLPFSSRPELSLTGLPLIRGLRAWALCSKSRHRAGGPLGQAPLSHPRPADVHLSAEWGLPLGLDARQAGMGALVTLQTSEGSSRTQTQCLFLHTDRGSCLYPTTKLTHHSTPQQPGGMLRGWLKGKTGTAPALPSHSGPNRARDRSGRRWRKPANHTASRERAHFRQQQQDESRVTAAGEQELEHKQSQRKKEPREETRDLPREETRDLPKEETRDLPKEETRDLPREETRDLPKEETRDLPREETRDLPREETRDLPKEETRDLPKEETRDLPKEETRDLPKEETRDLPKEETRDLPREETRDLPKEETRDLPRERSREETEDLPWEETGDLPRKESLFLHSNQPVEELRDEQQEEYVGNTTEDYRDLPREETSDQYRAQTKGQLREQTRAQHRDLELFPMDLKLQDHMIKPEVGSRVRVLIEEIQDCPCTTRKLVTAEAQDILDGANACDTELCCLCAPSQSPGCVLPCSPAGGSSCIANTGEADPLKISRGTLGETVQRSPGEFWSNLREDRTLDEPGQVEPRGYSPDPQWEQSSLASKKEPPLEDQEFGGFMQAQSVSRHECSSPLWNACDPAGACSSWDQAHSPWAVFPLHGTEHTVEEGGQWWHLSSVADRGPTSGASQSPVCVFTAAFPSPPACSSSGPWDSTVPTLTQLLRAHEGPREGSPDRGLLDVFHDLNKMIVQGYKQASGVSRELLQRSLSLSPPSTGIGPSHRRVSHGHASSQPGLL